MRWPDGTTFEQGKPEVGMETMRCGVVGWHHRMISDWHGAISWFAWVRSRGRPSAGVDAQSGAAVADRHVAGAVFDTERALVLVRSIISSTTRGVAPWGVAKSRNRSDSRARNPKTASLSGPVRQAATALACHELRLRVVILYN